MRTNKQQEIEEIEPIIVTDKIVLDEIINTYEVFGHIETISEITEEQSKKLLIASDFKGYFDTFNGIVNITYPLNVNVQVKIKDCFSIGALMWQIAQAYKIIYDEENISTEVKEIPLEERTGLINRNSTNGKYGIWGHDIGDLSLAAIHIHKNGNISIDVNS